MTLTALLYIKKEDIFRVFRIGIRLTEAWDWRIQDSHPFWFLNVSLKGNFFFLIGYLL